MIIRKSAYPRAGLIGNPSDGYFGKTIAFTFSNFQADVTLYETPELEILPNTRDHSRFKSVRGLAEDVRLFGYYGGIRLLKASVKRFYDYCCQAGRDIGDRNFTLRYESNIPHMVGLAGSSAIITACFRAMMEFYDVEIPKPELANLILSVENKELCLSAGLQDRVAQVYQGLIYMDFERNSMLERGYGRYEELETKALPNLYVAYRADLSEGSEVFHNSLRDRFERNDPEVLEAIRFWADLSEQVKQALLKGQGGEIGKLLNANFDKRAAICRVSEGNLRMVQAARSAGASAKFTGSGGAIIGTYDDEMMFTRLKDTLAPLRVEVIKPKIEYRTGGPS